MNFCFYLPHTNCMKHVVSYIGNFIWRLLGGVWLAAIWFLIGVALTITIVGYPLAVNCFRIGWLCLKPTNKRVGVYFEKYLPLNLLWSVLVGWMIIPFAVLSITLHILSIFGIPLILQWVKVGKVCMFPFGAIIK